MAPAEHIAWLQDNVDWFCSLAASQLDAVVPACPGWTVEYVVNHLTFGLGHGYPHALRAPIDCPHDEVFNDLALPSSMPAGESALTTFESVMGTCVDTFIGTDPAMPCYTYEGPGIAAFWFRRAAIETTLHRMDVVAGLHIEDIPLATDRVHDAIAESIDFALPMAAQLSDSSARAMRINVPTAERTFVLGDGDVAAEVSGDGTALLAALWGRSTDMVDVSGDQATATEWLGVIERAFAGR